MKKKLVIPLIVIIVICISITSFTVYRNQQYKNDFCDLFGDDKYIIENVDNGDIILYTLSEKNSNDTYVEFDVLESFINTLGYYHLPDRQLGCLYFFIDSNGNEIECEATHFRNYTEWYIYLANTEDDSLS